MSGQRAVARRAALAFPGVVALAACGGQGSTTPTPGPSSPVDNVAALVAALATRP